MNQSRENTIFTPRRVGV